MDGRQDAPTLPAAACAYASSAARLPAGQDRMVKPLRIDTTRFRNSQPCPMVNTLLLYYSLAAGDMKAQPFRAATDDVVNLGIGPGARQPSVPPGKACRTVSGSERRRG